MDAFKEAEWILSQIREFKKRKEEVENKAEKEIEKIKRKYEPELKILSSNIEEMERRLRDLCKKEKAVLFSRSDRVDLPSGSLIYHAKWWVRRARGVLKRLKELGITNAIKVTETVRWDVIEKWPDEKLFLIGTERILKEEFSYEIWEKKEERSESNNDIRQRAMGGV